MPDTDNLGDLRRRLEDSFYAGSTMDSGSLRGGHDTWTIKKQDFNGFMDRVMIVFRDQLERATKLKFKVFTYSYDSSGYYIGHSDENTVSVFAANNVDAKHKALELREGDNMTGTHDKWGAKVLEVEEQLVATKQKDETL